jgi:3-hydroxyisobutyrate dehydrogenase-like beta-hydroxyacid dehydrogenase
MAAKKEDIMEGAVGLIGLGAIGLPAAKNLIERGFRVYGYRRSSMTEFAEAGGRPVTSPRELAGQCSVIITCLPNAQALEEVTVGANGVLAAGRQDLVIVDLSMLKLSDKERMRDFVARGNGTFLDAPLSGLPVMVKQRTAVIFVSGDERVYEIAKPALDGITDKALYLGEFGVGTKMKFAANLLVGVHILATAETLAMSAKAGLPLDQVIKILSPSAATSLQFQVRAPMMAQHNWDTALASVTLFLKDMETIAGFAEEMGCPAPLIHAARDYFARAVEQGLGEKDVAAVYAVVAKEAGVAGEMESMRAAAP